MKVTNFLSGLLLFNTYLLNGVDARIPLDQETEKDSKSNLEGLFNNPQQDVAVPDSCKEKLSVINESFNVFSSLAVDLGIIDSSQKSQATKLWLPETVKIFMSAMKMLS